MLVFSKLCCGQPLLRSDINLTRSGSAADRRFPLWRRRRILRSAAAASRSAGHVAAARWLLLSKVRGLLLSRVPLVSLWRERCVEPDPNVFLGPFLMDRFSNRRLKADGAKAVLSSHISGAFGRGSGRAKTLVVVGSEHENGMRMRRAVTGGRTVRGIVMAMVESVPASKKWS